MEEKTLTLRDLGRHAETLVEMVFEQHDRIEERLSVQDVQFKGIWDAYTAMGITDKHYASSLIDSIRVKILETKNEEPYWEKYKQTNDELDRLLGLLKDQDNQLEVLKETEKVIVDLLILLNFQWDVLVAQLGSITKQIKVSRDTELAKVDEFWAIEPTFKDHPKSNEIKKAYAFEKEQLILEQIDLFESEQNIMTQMEFVCDERDRIFPISSELFLK
ncbi:MAG TPA: hypothetical protein DCL77_17540 [Prolixibacteraceae bacterium]|jgi:hypothetical protein|nr:hypothetical protein [Prolixibacteraceae bacterium]